MTNSHFEGDNGNVMFLKQTILVTLFVVIGMVLMTLFSGCDAASRELGPSALLRKYEWFKNTAAKLDALDASIRTKEAEIKDMQDTYPEDKSKWDRIDKENYLLMRKELSGMKMTYNNLASEYNAQMAKANWRFCNAGGLPEGADRVLPREFRSYLTK